MTELALDTNTDPNILHGERVTLRPYSYPFTEEELRRLYNWGRDDEVLRWSGGMPLHMTFQEFKVAFPREQRRRDQMVYVILTEANELIGRVAIFDIDNRAKDATLGIVLGEKKYWSHGYGTDAIRTLLKHLFDNVGFKSVHLFTYIDNHRAQRSFGKAGFHAVGQRRRFPFGLRSQDEMRMEVTRDDFARQLSEQEDTDRAR
ncbi:MAG: GNAT family N-acetyltransferase [Anaerolineae bacterium]